MQLQPGHTFNNRPPLTFASRPPTYLSCPSRASTAMKYTASSLFSLLTKNPRAFGAFITFAANSKFLFRSCQAFTPLHKSTTSSTCTPSRAFSSHILKSCTAFQRPSSSSSQRTMTSSSTTPSEPLDVAPSSSNKDHEDPYLWLEDVESPESLSFAKQANDECLSQLGDPKTSPFNTYQKVLSVLESNDRIAYVTKYGTSPNGDVMMYNLWKDSDNPKGLWRKTTFQSYKSSSNDPEWHTVLDIDALAKEDGISWVYKGNTKLSKSLDPLSTSQGANRTLSRAHSSPSPGVEPMPPSSRNLI